MSKQKSRLVKVDPRTVMVNESLLEPTKWDIMAVKDDLREYVSLSRVLKGTPLLRIVDGALVVISGLPFIHAAQQADPPMNEVICFVEADDKTAVQYDLRQVEASDLLDLYSEDKVYWAVERLTFWEVANVERQRRVEEKILNFFEVVSASPDTYGGDYVSLGEFFWEMEPSTVTWKWKRSDREGKHIFTFLELLSDIDREVLPIRSWNGIDVKQMV